MFRIPKSAIRTLHGPIQNSRLDLYKLWLGHPPMGWGTSNVGGSWKGFILIRLASISFGSGFNRFIQGIVNLYSKKEEPFFSQYLKFFVGSNEFPKTYAKILRLWFNYDSGNSHSDTKSDLKNIANNTICSTQISYQ